MYGRGVALLSSGFNAKGRSQCAWLRLPFQSQRLYRPDGDVDLNEQAYVNVAAGVGGGGSMWRD